MIPTATEPIVFHSGHVDGVCPQDYPITYGHSINNFFIAPPLKIRFAVPVERIETTIFNPRVEGRCFNPLLSYSQSNSQKSCYEIVYYVPRRTMRVIA